MRHVRRAERTRTLIHHTQRTVIPILAELDRQRLTGDRFVSPLAENMSRFDRTYQSDNEIKGITYKKKRKRCLLFKCIVNCIEMFWNINKLNGGIRYVQPKNITEIYYDYKNGECKQSVCDKEGFIFGFIARRTPNLLLLLHNEW